MDDDVARHMKGLLALLALLLSRTSLVALGQNESAPKNRGASKIDRSKPQAATWVGLSSRAMRELMIGIARGFIASGISRARSTCRSPFSRLAPLTST